MIDDELRNLEAGVEIDPKDADRGHVTITDAATRCSFRAPVTKAAGRWVLGSRTALDNRPDVDAHLLGRHLGELRN